LAFALPSPYVIHEPMEGRPITLAPVFMSVMLGS
jgi:hypothetical protein